AVDERDPAVVPGERGVDEFAHRAARRLVRRGTRRRGAGPGRLPGHLLLHRSAVRRAHATSSRIVALAWPPASHIVCRPKREPVSLMWWTRSVMMREPEPPSGCPSAIAPPFGFTRSQSTPISR